MTINQISTKIVKKKHLRLSLNLALHSSVPACFVNSGFCANIKCKGKVPLISLREYSELRTDAQSNNCLYRILPL